MKNYILVITSLVILFLFACKKSKKETSNETINGDYYGMFANRTYITFTGQTTIDTIDINLKLNTYYNSTDKVLSIISINNKLNGITLTEDTSTYNNTTYKRFDFIDTQNNWRIYRLQYYKLVNKDSVTISTYLPPQGGWNSTDTYIGIKQ